MKVKLFPALFVLVLVLTFPLSSVSAGKELKVSPGRIRINVKNVPEGLSSLAIPLTVDATIVTIKRATSTVNGALVVFGSNSEGVGIVDTKGSLPSKFSISVEFNAVSQGETNVSAGEAVDKIGGEKIEGVVIKSPIKTLKVKSKK